MVKVGICADNPDALQAIKEAGFNCVMLYEFKNMEDVIKQAQGLGLEVSYVHLDGRAAIEFWTKGLMNELGIQRVIESIKLCSKYGISTVVLHPTFGSTSMKAVGPTEQGLSSMKQVVAAAEKYKVKIALENLDPYSKKHLTYLLDNLDSPWVGLCYDSGHHYLYTKTLPVLKKYGHRCFAVHIHDNNMNYEVGADNSRDAHFLPGDGKIDFKKVMKELRDVKYNNAFILEVYRTFLNGQSHPKYGKLDPLEFYKKAYKRAVGLLEMK